MRQSKAKQATPALSERTKEIVGSWGRGTTMFSRVVRLLIVLVVSSAVLSPADLSAGSVSSENDTIPLHNDNQLASDIDLAAPSIDDDDDWDFEDDKKQAKKKKSKRKSTRKNKRKSKRKSKTDWEDDVSEDPNLAYVKETLRDYLEPTRIKWLKGGRVELFFDFQEKRPGQETSFFPPVRESLKSTFRWSVMREESRYYWYGNRGSRGGLRVSDRGITAIKCWFFEDVVAEMTFSAGASFHKNNVMTLGYYNKRGNGVGNNMGTQSVQLKRGKILRNRVGKLNGKNLNLWHGEKIKLSVKNGKAKSYLSGKKTAERKYRRRGMESGRIGFVWGGRMAGMITNLRIVGRIDAKKMADEMKKARK